MVAEVPFVDAVTLDPSRISWLVSFPCGRSESGSMVRAIEMRSAVATDCGMSRPLPIALDSTSQPKRIETKIAVRQLDRHCHRRSLHRVPKDWGGPAHTAQDIKSLKSDIRVPRAGPPVNKRDLSTGENGENDGLGRREGWFPCTVPSFAVRQEKRQRRGQHAECCG